MLSTQKCGVTKGDPWAVESAAVRAPHYPTYDLQRREPFDDRSVLTPLNRWRKRVAGQSCLRNGFSLHLQISGCIAISRIHIRMTQPITDVHNIHAGPKQKDRAGVPHAVRMKTLTRQGRACVSTALAMFRENVANSKSRQPFTALVTEDGRIRARVKLSFTDEFLQDRRGLRPQWTNPDLASFTEKLDLRWRFELKITGSQIHNLLGSGTSVEHEREQCVVATTSRSGSIDAGKHCSEFIVFHIVDGSGPCALKGNT